MKGFFESDIQLSLVTAAASHWIRESTVFILGRKSMAGLNDVNLVEFEQACAKNVIFNLFGMFIFQRKTHTTP